MTRIALAAMFAMGLILVPAFNSTGTVLAQRGQKGVEAKAVDTENVGLQQIARAVRLGAAGDVTVYAENGVATKGTSTVKGQVLSLTNGGEKASNVRKSLTDSFSAINQLPCTELSDTDLTGKTYGPGIYCMSSARLSGQLVLDGQGNPDSFFIFRVKGNVETEKGSGVSVIGEAFASAVYFVADDSATIGEGSNVKGNFYARNSVVVNDNTVVDGRVLSLKGDVSLGANAILGPEQTGVLQICKDLDTRLGTGLEGRVFQFQVGGPNGQIVEAVAGQCSRQVTVAAGPGLLIEELLTGRTTTGGNFNGGFQLVAVNAITPTTAVTARNLPARQAIVTIRAGDASNQTIIQFINRVAITGIVEICKEALDLGVDSFFNFTIAEVVDANGIPITFTAPTGQCTGPITVQVPPINGGIVNNGTPRTGVVNVTEAPRLGAIFAGGFTADGTVAPTNRLLNVDLPGRTIRAVLVEGGVTSQTTIFFVNRTLAQLKICKIGAFGINEFTPFTFLVSGTGPTFAPGVNGFDPGTQTATTVTVLAGTVAAPSCEIVPLTFLSGTGITITELTNAVSSGPGSVETRVSRITSTSGITAPVTRAANVPYFPPNSGAAGTRTVTVPAARETVEVEFVNIPFLPVPLKICKIAGGAGTLVGTSFIFDVTTGTTGGANNLEDPNDLLGATATGTVSVVAGPGGIQNGFCDFVAGPATSPLINGLGSFNLFTPLTVTERASAGNSVTSIFTPNNTPVINANLATRSGFIPALFNGVNEVVFVNTPTVAAIPNKTKRFRMQF